MAVPVFLICKDYFDRDLKFGHLDETGMAVALYLSDNEDLDTNQPPAKILRDLSVYSANLQRAGKPPAWALKYRWNPAHLTGFSAGKYLENGWVFYDPDPINEHCFFVGIDGGYFPVENSELTKTLAPAPPLSKKEMHDLYSKTFPQPTQPEPDESNQKGRSR